MKLAKVEYYVFLYFLLTLGILLNRGFYSWQALIVVFICFILLNVLPRFIKNKDQRFFLLTIIIFSICLSLFSAGGIYEQNLLTTLCYKFGYALSLFTSLTYLWDKKNQDRQDNKRFYLLVFIAILVRFLIIINSPAPAIDVFYLLKEAPKALISGQNPYKINYTQVYPNFKANYYAYWPGSFLIMIPIVYLFRDPRVLLILAELITALIIFHLRKEDLTGEFLALIFLFNPASLFIIEQSWLNPLNTVFVAILILLLTQKKLKYWLIGIVSGILSSIQFHFLLLIPILAKTLSFSKKYLLSGLFSAVIIILPFFLWSPKDFIYDTIETWIKRPAVVPIPFFMSLNFNALFYRLTGKELPLIFSGTIITAIITVLFFKLQKNDPSDFLKKVIISFFALFLFGTQAFINYYYFLGNLLLILAAL